MLHLIIGPVGAGKSTLGRHLAATHGGVRLTLDDWMARLYGDDPRPATDRLAWYAARTARCLALIWELTEALARAQTPVILEIGLVRRAERARFYAQVDAAGLPLTVHLVDAPRAVRRARVAQRNAERGPGFHVVVPPAFFELASDAWEPPDIAELRERAIRVAP